MPVIGLLEGQRLRYRLGAAELNGREWSARGPRPYRGNQGYAIEQEKVRDSTDWRTLYVQDPVSARASYNEINRFLLDPEALPSVESWLEAHGGIPQPPAPVVTTPVTPIPTTPADVNTPPTSTTNPPLMTDAQYQKFLADQLAYANYLANHPADIPAQNPNILPDPAPMPTPTPDPATPAVAEKSMFLPIAAALLAFMVLK